MALLTSGLRRGVQAVAVTALLLAASPSPAVTTAAAQSRVTEARAKASFLYNLLLFADWPADALGSGAAIVVGVAGSTPVLAELRAFEGQVVAGRAVRVREIREGENPAGCHLLFVAASGERQVSLLLSKIQLQPVLTVGEDDRFLAWGGIVRVFVGESRMRFEVDLSRAERGRLRLSSKLLSLATRVVRDGDVITR